MRSICLFLIFTAVPIIKSAILYEDQIEIAGHEGQCHDEGGTTFYNEGDIMKSDENTCSQKICLGHYSPTGKIRIQTLTCPAVEAGVGYIVVEDLNKPYPDCCPQLKPKGPHPNSFCRTERRE